MPAAKAIRLHRQPVGADIGIVERLKMQAPLVRLVSRCVLVERAEMPVDDRRRRGNRCRASPSPGRNRQQWLATH